MPTILLCLIGFVLCAERLAEALYRVLADGFLNMEIMLSHLGVGMTYDALDGLNIHAQRLHLRHIGVAAAVRREQADIARFFQRLRNTSRKWVGLQGKPVLGLSQMNWSVVSRSLMAHGRTFSGTGISRILSLDFGLPMLTVPFTTFTACRM